MGNCLRMPEDHTSLLPIPSTHYASMSVSSSSSHPTSTTSDSSIPKVEFVFLFIYLILKHLNLYIQLVTVNRSSGNPTDIHLIKAAQCRNLFEHLPLTNYNEKQIKQTE